MSGECLGQGGPVAPDGEAPRSRSAAAATSSSTSAPFRSPPATHTTCSYAVRLACAAWGFVAFESSTRTPTPFGGGGGVRSVDDSKATNPHAAQASLTAYEHVVWVAGGLLKGADVDELVAAAADRLRGVVLIGRDRAALAEALARHAPDVPVVDVERTDTGAMDLVVREALALAHEGESSCSHRPPRPWTCSPTTARAVTPSSDRSTGSPRGSSP